MSASEASYYDLLGVDREVSNEAIRGAYSRALRRFRKRLTAATPPAPEQLDALRLAYKSLSDPELRKAYDQQLAAEVLSAPGNGAPPPVPVVAPRGGRPEAREWRFRFTGDGGEYFRIWIVNLLFSILTLGIYSAWAKVRREQYFHRHLRLDDTPFDYHGQPTAILKGRAIAFVLLMVLSLSQKVGPAAYGLALLCIVPLVPWLAIRALRFRAFNTSYRGLRFSFHGTYGEAFKVFVLYGFLAMFTLWLAFPLWYRRLRQFIFDHLRYGSGEFRCSVGVGQIYRAIAGPVLSLLGLLVAIAVVFGALGGVSRPTLVMLGILMLSAIVLLFQLTIFPWVTARLSNAVWSSVQLEQHRFRSSLRVGRYIALSVVNWLAIIVTLGLFFPWARVRMARYRAECLCIEATCDLDAFVAGEMQNSTALGDEAAEMFDLDVAI